MLSFMVVVEMVNDLIFLLSLLRAGLESTRFLIASVFIVFITVRLFCDQCYYRTIFTIFTGYVRDCSDWC